MSSSRNAQYITQEIGFYTTTSAGIYQETSQKKTEMAYGGGLAITSGEMVKA